MEPRPVRFRVADEAGALRIVIPAETSWFVLLFLSAWLAGWGWGWVNVFEQLLNRGLLGNWFDLIWLAAWTCFGAMALYQIAWMIGGREIIVVDGIFLTLGKAVFGISLPARQFRLQDVNNLRFIPESGEGKSRVLSRIGFDYGSKSYDFAQGTNEVEANQILNVISRRTVVQARR